MTSNAVKALILDMDGVLWRGDEPIGDLAAIFEAIHRQGWTVALATNNATRTVSQYLQKLAGFGVQLEPWQVVTSATATAAYLRRQHPGGGAVFILGENGLVQTLAEAGFIHQTEHPLAVIASLDRGLTYAKLRDASLWIRTGVPFIGTNPDRTLPSPAGQIPGAGAILAALVAATDVQPLVIGKPNTLLFQQALERLGTKPGETLVVGDRLDTDIAGGQAAGCLTGLVLSGVTTNAQVQDHPTPLDWIAPDLQMLLESVAAKNHEI